MAAEKSVLIHSNITRISRDFLNEIVQFPSGYFVDIQGRRGALDYGIRPMFQSGRVFGTAVTVKTVPDDNLTPYVALEILKPGDVLVISTGNWSGSAVVGDLIVGMFKNAGVAAIVTDGLVRDIEGLEQVGVPIFARGLSPNSPQKHGPGEIGGEVVIGGVSVRTGDLIVGDRDGVVCLGAQRFGSAVSALNEVRRKEAVLEQQIREGMTTPAWVKTYAESNVAYVD
ncbi:MAG: RraA family protein [Xanthobacteraceae bacterium]